ncbi:hypothetical protein [Pararhizobium haloflavum]|uniref:hypothetical protein n=1 Tax=Pararhizobium haloflavum TaxID=2037914 RepID=UPI000C1A5731|nr:hypothetical protein [Pararhizobium haloflavum]
MSAKKTSDTAAAAGADQSPAPATETNEASGAIIEPQITEGIDLEHPAIDNNPRARTSAEQNRRDMNDPRRRKPNAQDFAGKGLDPTPYGQPSKSSKKRKK